MQGISDGERNRIISTFLDGEFGSSRVRVHLPGYVHIEIEDSLSAEDEEWIKWLCRDKFGVDKVKIHRVKTVQWGPAIKKHSVWDWVARHLKQSGPSV